MIPESTKLKISIAQKRRWRNSPTLRASVCAKLKVWCLHLLIHPPMAAAGSGCSNPTSDHAFLGQDFEWMHSPTANSACYSAHTPTDSICYWLAGESGVEQGQEDELGDAPEDEPGKAGAQHPPISAASDEQVPPGTHSHTGMPASKFARHLCI